ncbi:MAG: malonyl-CoA decarboxylase family protein, partial [Rhodocyclaceae bacterium]|nr:malonyl-CoA decarboxylase family protein [Rhodocyclaceae bacterium]
AFLEMRRLTWDSPASLLEKMIRYEAVHDIRDWADLKNRLDCDRRCYGFFHPRLPDEPLIFVEIALLQEVAASVAPLLDEHAETADAERANTAIFYSISNTQTGLRGVSFGNSLIKHVVQTLQAELPRLRTFATLSPMPGFHRWLNRQGEASLETLPEKLRAELAEALPQGDAPLFARLLDAAKDAPEREEKSPVREALLRLAAHYLGKSEADGRVRDPVARFHLGNGARVERINWAGDLSARGRAQSFGMMVNYLYDLKRLDQHRSQLAKGRVPASREVRAWLSD